MNTVYDFIYQLFSWLYSPDFHEHLKGLSENHNNLVEGFSWYGLSYSIMLVVTILVLLIYYVGPFNKSPYNTNIRWFIFLIINALIHSISYYSIAFSYNGGIFCDDYDLTNDLIGFGFSGLIIAALLFWLLSYFFRLFSSNNGTVPKFL